MASRRASPSALDCVVTLTHRRDLARGRAEAAERDGQVLHSLCWRLIESEALTLAAYVSGDQLWQIQAEQQRARISHRAIELEAALSPQAALPHPSIALAS